MKNNEYKRCGTSARVCRNNQGKNQAMLKRQSEAD